MSEKIKPGRFWFDGYGKNNRGAGWRPFTGFRRMRKHKGIARVEIRYNGKTLKVPDSQVNRWPEEVNTFKLKMDS